MKVVGRSGAVMDLPEQLARALLRDDSVKLVEEPEVAPAPTDPAEPVVVVVDYAAAGRITEPQPEQLPKASAADVRAWAADNGIDCPDRGRVPLKVVQAYIQAHQEG